jgi:acyl-CoA reductase-like NAD-dependent aldehyde dehydrogenase
METRVVHNSDELTVSLHYVPIGVVGAICPWNYPLVLAMGKICAALSTGNCVIVKPSPFTPYATLKFVEIVQDIFHRGVLQALNGDAKLGTWMTSHPGIQKITFTGSIATGKRIMAAASSTLKRVTLELGGNSASIVCPDVNIKAVAPQIAVGSFLNSGQFSVASKRIYVHRDIYDEFLSELVGIVRSWKTGPASMEGIMLGPIQNDMQYEVVKKFFDDTRSKGYKFALEGGAKDGTGFVIQPAIIDNPPDHSMVVTQEPFGMFSFQRQL